MRLAAINVGLAICAAALSGCAVHRAGGSSFDAMLIRQGTPRVQVPAGPGPDPEQSVSTYMAKWRELSTRLRPTPAETVTAEITDARLRVAIAGLGGSPTAESESRLAEAYRQARILDQAYDHFAAARKLDSTYAPAYDGLARIWRDWGFPALALGDAHRAVYFAPDSPAAFNTLGTVFQALGRPEQARAAFQKALSLDRSAGYAATNLCYSALLAGRRYAVGVCENAARLSPESDVDSNNLGLALGLAGQIDRARRAFTRGGDAATVDYNLGIVLSLRHEFKDAEAAFRLAARTSATPLKALRRAEQARAAARNEGSHDRH